MSDQPSGEKPKFDPFKPAEPRLPGVPERKPPKPAAKPPEGATGEAAPVAAVEQQPALRGAKKLLAQFRALPPLAQYGSAAVAFLLVVSLVVWLAGGSGETPAPAAPPTTSSESAALPPGSPRVTSGVAVEIVTLPAPVATTQEMAKPWTAKRFIVRQAGQRTPAMVVRVPAGSAGTANGYWAFLLTSPFGRCELELLDDLEKLQSEYGYRAQHAMVVDPCSRAVFHPLRMGSIGQSTYVRGEVVQGSALRPPIAIDLRVERGQVIAVRTE